MQLPINSKETYGDITNFVINYIKKNKLQDKTDLKKIIPDEKITKLFNLENNMQSNLTYFNIHRYINMHIIKS